IVMDVRFLQNPHWVKDLKPLSGLDKKVGDYVSKDPDFAEFMENFKTLIAPLIPRYAAEGKSYLTIAIGCTGGRHRSVFTVEELAKWMKTQGHTTHIDHRDLKV
ncbi:MAG: RapZ C-terminal domain-containing protein, partial [Bdellovibrionales bacterium]